MFDQCKINFAKLNSIDSPQISPTVGNFPVRFTCFSESLISAFIQSCLVKEVFVPLSWYAWWQGWHLPWDFIFKLCVVQHLWYLLTLDYQPCLFWTSWGSLHAPCVHAVLVVSYTCKHIWKLPGLPCFHHGNRNLPLFWENLKNYCCPHFLYNICDYEEIFSRWTS